MRQFNVVDNVFVLVPLRFGWVGGGQNRCARIQLTNDSGFGDTQCLLFHHLVQYAARGVVHFVELINATDAVISQYQGTAAKQDRVERVAVFEREKGAYVCKTSCLVSASLVTYAVKPTADEPRPDVYCDRGTKL